MISTMIGAPLSSVPNANFDLLSDIDLEIHSPLQSQNPVTKSEEAIIHDKNGLQIKLILSMSDTVVNAKAIFMNITPVVFKDVKFLVSTPKVCYF